MPPFTIDDVVDWIILRDGEDGEYQVYNCDLGPTLGIFKNLFYFLLLYQKFIK